jgi:hypothetical protein
MHGHLDLKKSHFDPRNQVPDDESPNVYSFTDKDLGLSTDEPNFDQYDFYYNLEDLQEPPKMDDEVISNMQLPTSQKWSYYL